MLRAVACSTEIPTAEKLHIKKARIFKKVEADAYTRISVVAYTWKFSLEQPRNRHRLRQ